MLLELMVVRRGDTTVEWSKDSSLLLCQVGDVHAGAGRKAAVFELMARPDAALDFAAAMQGAGHSVAPRWAIRLP